MECPHCNTKLFTVVDVYEIDEIEGDKVVDYLKYINRDAMVVHESYLRETLRTTRLIFLYDGGDQMWCEKCDALYIYCCEQPCMLTSVCCMAVGGGWYTRDDPLGELIKHDWKDWPYEYLHEDSNISVESMGIINVNDSKLDHVFINGEEGGCPISFKCKKCGEIYWCSEN